jgi:hypothetical protein
MLLTDYFYLVFFYIGTVQCAYYRLKAIFRKRKKDIYRTNNTEHMIIVFFFFRILTISKYRTNTYQVHKHYSQTQ